jgi:hypothetical protein
VFLKDQSNNRYPLARMDARDFVDSNNTSFYPFPGYIIEDNTLKIIASNGIGGNTIQFSCAVRINSLVPSIRTAIITGITDNGSTYTLDVDTDLTSVILADCDFYPTSPQFSLLAEDVTPTSVTSTQIVVPASSVEDKQGALILSVGDAVAASTTANLLMLPQEFDPILAQQASLYILEGLGDRSKYELAVAKLARMMQSINTLIQNRVENSPKHIMQRFGFRSFNYPRVFNND